MNKPRYSFLLRNYSRVNQYLSKKSPNEDEFTDMVISFCVVVEKVFKIKLHRKNPFLVFDPSRFKDRDAFIRIALKKENSIETSKFNEIVIRFKEVFNEVLNEDEEQILLDIYKVRNKLIHSYKPDNKLSIDRNDLLKKMGTVWEKISDITARLFTKEQIEKRTPKKKYTEKELENVLEKEVREMIKPKRRGIRAHTSTKKYKSSVFLDDESVFSNSVFDIRSSPYGIHKKKCPRCGEMTFSKEDDFTDVILPSYSESPNLYKCGNCDLELTERQYRIAKKLDD